MIKNISTVLDYQKINKSKNKDKMRKSRMQNI